MKPEMILELIVLIGAAVGFGYGFAQTMLRRAPLYARMITGAMGCLMLGHLSIMVRMLCGITLKHDFTLDALSALGVFLFFLTANLGQMDSLADDGSARFKKYRLIALLAPLTILCLYIPVALSGMKLIIKILYGIGTAVIALASYYHLKHVIFPDVDFGVIRCIRPYNVAALVCAVLHMGLLLTKVTNYYPMKVAIYLLIAVDAVMIPPLLVKGVRKWTI